MMVMRMIFFYVMWLSNDANFVWFDSTLSIVIASSLREHKNTEVYFPRGHAIQHGDTWLISSRAWKVEDLFSCLSPRSLVLKDNI